MLLNLTHKITPFLWYERDADQAAALYLRLFGNGRLLNTQLWGEGGAAPVGSLMAVTFELHGQTLVAFNGGPHFKLNEATSLMVLCDDQAEVDHLWAGLTADGGQESQCGWLRDRFGLWWQIQPRAFMQMMADPDGARVARVTQAMYTMGKMDLAALQRAYDGR